MPSRLQGVADGARAARRFPSAYSGGTGPARPRRVRVHGFHFALDRLAIDVDDPAARQLQVDHVAFFQVDDLVRRAGSAIASDATKFSPLPRPTIRGEPWRAATTRCGSSRQNTAIAYAPSRRLTACCTVSNRSPLYMCSTKWADHFRVRLALRRHNRGPSVLRAVRHGFR